MPTETDTPIFEVTTPDELIDAWASKMLTYLPGATPGQARAAVAAWSTDYLSTLVDRMTSALELGICRQTFDDALLDAGYDRYDH